MILQLTKAAFLKEIWAFDKMPIFTKKDDIPRVVFFYVENSRCDIQNNVLEHLSELFSERIQFYKVNVLEEQLLAADLGIRRIPALLFIVPEKDPKIATGLFSVDILQKTFNQFFKK